MNLQPLIQFCIRTIGAGLSVVEEQDYVHLHLLGEQPQHLTVTEFIHKVQPLKDAHDTKERAAWEAINRMAHVHNVEQKIRMAISQSRKAVDPDTAYEQHLERFEPHRLDTEFEDAQGWT